jgi:glutamate synthase (NADPH) small chain
MTEKPDLKINRLEPGYRDIAERLGDFNEVEKSLSIDEIKAQASRCLTCGTPFCHGYACPLANIVPEINEFISMGRWKDALKLLLSTHPFPEFTARICPALCEGSCVLGINESPVTIRQVEKMIIETGFEKGWVRPRPPLKRRTEEIAVIGSGPAGLAAAERLNRKGYRVTVFEKELNPGGLLTYGIPNFKLDKRIVMRRIKLMQDEGVIFECGTEAGRDLSFNYLKRHFSVIILTGGTGQPRDLDIPGRELKGIHFAMDLLKAQNKRLLGEPLTGENDISARGKKVAVIGGGDTGSDCIGTVLRQGAKSVCQLEIMPRAPESRAEENPWPLWPLIDRASSSHQEGGNRRWSVDTKMFEGNREGEVKRLHCCEVKWAKEEGRAVPVRIENTDFVIEADLVLLALGFLGPGPDPLADAIGLERDQRGSLLVNAQHMTSMPGIFSAGDMARGQSLVVRAIADGVAAAEDVDSYL